MFRVFLPLAAKPNVAGGGGGAVAQLFLNNVLEGDDDGGDCAAHTQTGGRFRVIQARH